MGRTSKILQHTNAGATACPTACSRASKKTKKPKTEKPKNPVIQKWITLRVTNCKSCGRHSSKIYSFVHATDPETGLVSKDEPDDYFCDCGCGGMGHYVGWCTKCGENEEISDVEDI